MIVEYREMIESLLASLYGALHADAVALANLLEQIRLRKAELLSGNVKKRAA